MLIEMAGISIGIIIYKLIKQGETMSTKEQKLIDYKPKEVQFWPESKVTLIGAELISTKLSALMRYIIRKEENHGVNTIVISLNSPKKTLEDGTTVNVLAGYNFESGAVVLNMNEHMNDSIVGFDDPEVERSMRIGTKIHANMLLSLIHEIYESHRFVDNDPYQVEALTEEDEAHLDETAKQVLTELAMEVNIEPAPVEEESQIIKEFIKEIEHIAIESDDDWATRYKTLIEKGIMYAHNDGTEIATLRKWYKLAAGVAEGEVEDEKWPEDVPTITHEMFDAIENNKSQANTADPATGAVQLTDSNGAVSNSNGTGIMDESMLINSAVGNAEVTITSEVAVEDISGTGFTEQSQPTFPVPTPQPNAIVEPQQNTPVQTPQMDIQSMLNSMSQLCLLIEQAIFNNCGYQLNSDQGFCAPENVYQFIDIQNIPNAQQLVSHCTTKDGEGNTVKVNIWQPEVNGWPVGHIRGIVWDKGTHTSTYPIPGYNLDVNVGTVFEKRTFVPQNCNKTDSSGAFTKWAMEARQGVRRLMVIDDKVTAKGLDNKFKIRILVENGEVKFKPFGQ
jgi:hypothetical protein